MTPLFFFFNDTATTEIYTLSLHDALPISMCLAWGEYFTALVSRLLSTNAVKRSEEHTSELQSHLNLVCRLLLEKKKETALVAHVCASVQPEPVSCSDGSTTGRTGGNHTDL